MHYTKVPMIIRKNNKPRVMIQPLPKDNAPWQDIVSTAKTAM
jgi:hypothetical protein